MRRVALALSATALLLAACTTLYEELPEADTVVTTPAGPIIRLPIVVTPAPTPTPAATPTPGPGSTPAPTPAPTPGPTPQPTPTPTSSLCSTPGTGSGESCPRTSPSFLNEVHAAIDTLAERRPDLFNFNDQRGDRGWRVLQPVEYHHAVAGILIERGLCAMYDGEEMAVKNTNAFSDQYDIHLSTGHVRRGAGSYMVTCSPAWF